MPGAGQHRQPKAEGRKSARLRGPVKAVRRSTRAQIGRRRCRASTARQRAAAPVALNVVACVDCVLSSEADCVSRARIISVPAARTRPNADRTATRTRPRRRRRRRPRDSATTCYGLRQQHHPSAGRGLRRRRRRDVPDALPTRCTCGAQPPLPGPSVALRSRRPQHRSAHRLDGRVALSQPTTRRHGA